MNNPTWTKGSMNVDTRTVNCLSLCSGIGGLEIGLGLVVPEFRVVCHVEREASAAALLVARMADKSLDEAPIWDDLTTFDGAAWRGTVDFVTAGFPCQPWSVAGQRKGTDDERWIWSDIIRIIREVRPGLVFLENVPGLLVHAGLGSVLAELAEAGFDAEWGCFTAAEVGASHRRERVFILGYTGRRPVWFNDGERWNETPIVGAASCAVGNTEGTGSPATEFAGQPCRFEQASDVLADTASIRRQDVSEGTRKVCRQEQGWREESETGCGLLADAGCQHVNVQQRAVGREPARGSEPMADPKGERYEAWGVRSGNETAHTRPHGEVSIFPPNPNDLEGWAQVLAEMPSLEPAVCRVADGIPNRVDRLRALGNAVVSLEAAYAFETLTARKE